MLQCTELIVLFNTSQASAAGFGGSSGTWPTGCAKASDFDSTALPCRINDDRPRSLYDNRQEIVASILTGHKALGGIR